MPSRDIYLWPNSWQAWDEMLLREKQALVERLADRLPEGFAFAGFERLEPHGLSRDVAVFRFRDGCEFVFIPAQQCRVGLSYEDFQNALGSYQRETLEMFCKEYEVDPARYPGQAFTTPRSVFMGGLLVERHARDAKFLNEEPVFTTDPWVRALLRGELPLKQGPGITHTFRWRKSFEQQYYGTTRGDFRAEWEYDSEADQFGPLRFVYHLQAINRHRVNGIVADDGMRLPSEDEWETFAGAGSRGLYYWGNTAPEEFPRGYWPQHPWGLHISRNPYNYEMVSDNLDLRKGGDGGGHNCGGDGLGDWVPLVTAYRGNWPTYSQDGTLGYLSGWVRRVCDVPPPGESNASLGNSCQTCP